MSIFYYDDSRCRKQFEYNVSKVESDIQIIREKYSNVSRNANKLSIFKMYMALRQEQGIEPEVKVSHQNIFRVHCDYHCNYDMSLTIYDKMGYAVCYGCGETITTIDLITEYIKSDKEFEKYKIKFDSVEGLAIEVADALINGVEYSYDEKGNVVGHERRDYEYANDINLVLYFVDKISKRYNSPLAQKYLDMSAAMTEKQDERISNYINIHGIEITDKFANKLCLDKKYIKYRLYSHSLDDKITMDRIIELSVKRGKNENYMNPFDDRILNEKIITFYEDNDDMVDKNVGFLTELFRNLDGISGDFTNGEPIIRDVKINERDNEFEFSIWSNYTNSSTTYKINVARSNGVKDIVYSSIFRKSSNPEATILSIVGGDIILERFFPNEPARRLIDLLEEHGVEVLFANNKYTYSEDNSPYILNFRPVSRHDESNYARLRYNYRSSYDSRIDKNLEETLNLLFGQRKPIFWMLGEIIIKTTLPEVWEKVKNNNGHSIFISGIRGTKVIHISDQGLSRCNKNIEPELMENRKARQKSLEGSNEHRFFD